MQKKKTYSKQKTLKVQADDSMMKEKKKTHNTYILSASLPCIAAWMPVRGRENPHPLTRTGQTALRLNKQDLRTISSPSQVGLGSASGSTVVSTVVTNSHAETSVSVRGRGAVAGPEGN